MFPLRPFRRLAAFVCCFLLFAIPTGVAAAEERVALVVGNSVYASIPQLPNPGNDARLIAQTLESRGFTVTLVVDADQVAMNRAIAQFGRDLRAAGPEATGLFYYAGHGLQSFGTNYLLPVDTSLTDAADLPLVAVRAEAVLRQMRSARNRTNIFILDACRNNPFESIPEFGDNGLAEMKAPTGSFLAFSTQPGAVAFDGKGENSPFSRALASQIAVEGKPIEAVFKGTRVAVLAETNGRQIPWDSSSLTREFYFTPVSTDSSQNAEAEQLWNSVKSTRDPLQVTLFLRAYPDSRFAGEARDLLNTLRAAESGAQVATNEQPVVRAQPPTPTPREVQLISIAQSSGEATDYEAYLLAFPNGVFAELARSELATIRAKEDAAAKPAPKRKPKLTFGSGPAKTKAPAEMTFVTPLTEGGPEVEGQTIAQLMQGSPLFPPIEGIPDSMWKGQTCTNCHAWTRDDLCTQGKTYMSDAGKKSLAKEHPLGGAFKRGLHAWAQNECR